MERRTKIALYGAITTAIAIALIYVLPAVASTIMTMSDLMK